MGLAADQIVEGNASFCLLSLEAFYLEILVHTPSQIYYRGYTLYSIWYFHNACRKLGIMSKKRHREQPTVDAQVVEIYEDLANESEEIRLKAAQSLLSKSAYENSPSGEQLDKTLSRLIRGLCSGRKAARLGFSVALTELLIQLLGPSRRDVEGFSLSVVGLIRLLEEQTRVTGNVSGQVYQSFTIMAAIDTDAQIGRTRSSLRKALRC